MQGDATGNGPREKIWEFGHKEGTPEKNLAAGFGEA